MPSSPTTPRTSTVHGLIAAQAAETPEAVAIVHGETELTYEQVGVAVGRLAHRLVAAGVRPGDVVALAMSRSPLFPVAALAVLTAGGAYLPLNGRQPPDRLAWMIDESRAVLAVTDGSVPVPDGTRAERMTRADLAPEGPAEAPDVRVHPESLAYVMYTSGSTGRPKAVACTHHNIADFLDDPWWRSGRQSAVLAYSPLDFDSSTYELWVPLAHGGRAVIWDSGRFDVRELRRVIRQEKITAAYFTTALFDTVAHEDAGALEPLREVITGGDVLSVAAVRRIREHCPATTVVHAYGPTETTVFCSLQSIEPGPTEVTLDLGVPMAGTVEYVLDADLHAAAPGETGELYVSGVRLARGYLNRPGMTAQRFLPDPFGPPGSRMYRTGDLARRDADGAITFAGRADRQVKLRGFRIEPGEVEAVLVADDMVGQAVVTVRDDLPGGRALVAHLVPAPGASVDVEDVRRSMSSALPDYMIPSAFVVLAELPLTAQGKVDRAALPRPGVEGQAGRSPRTELEQVLCALFTEILQCPPVGADDDFFALGGQSLLAIRLSGRIEAATGDRVPVREIFRRPTAAGLAEYLRDEAGRESQ